MTHRCELQAYLDEHTFGADGKAHETNRGCWEGRRTLDLPFRPFKGLVLSSVCDLDEEASLSFEVQYVDWDCRGGCWQLTGRLNLVLAHESSEEMLQAAFAPWTFTWQDASEVTYAPAKRKEAP